MFDLGIQRILLVLLAVMSYAIVCSQDSIEVELTCPDHVTINCEDELGDIASYGVATYRVGEEINDMENQQSKKSIDECGKGTVERIWRYKSKAGDEYRCSQFIYVGQTEDRKPLIQWPTKEVTVSWCAPSYKPQDLPPAAQGPKYYEGECNKMEHTYADEIVYLSEGCKEVHRNWLVHDWCYDSKSIEGNNGHYKFTQVIKFAVPEEVSYGKLEEVYVEAADCEKVYVDLPDMEADIENCNRRVRIKNDSPFADQNRKNASGTYPVGETVIRYSVELACTETRQFEQRIVVVDPCKQKAIIASEELETKLMRSFVRPNPFSQSTEIYFQNDEQQSATVVVKNIKGVEIMNREVTLAQNSMQSISIKEIQRPGVYIYSITLGERTLEGKLLKIR